MLQDRSCNLQLYHCMFNVSSERLPFKKIETIQFVGESLHHITPHRMYVCRENTRKEKGRQGKVELYRIMREYSWASCVPISSRPSMLVPYGPFLMRSSPEWKPLSLILHFRVRCHTSCWVGRIEPQRVLHLIPKTRLWHTLFSRKES